MTRKLTRYTLAIAVVCFIAALALFTVAANETPPAAPAKPRTTPLHPAITLLDEAGTNVLTSGKPISTMQTCGACHDTAFIASHSFHADVGLSSVTSADTGNWVHSWDTSPGAFGRWNPILYRYLSPVDDDVIDLTTAGWISAYGGRHVGGGPSTTGLDGQPLTSLDGNDPQTQTMIVNAQGELVAWDWATSGVVEMNCFVCHINAPNNAARKQALANGAFAWANTASLDGTGIVSASGAGYAYSAEAFTPEGTVKAATIGIQDPTSANCGACHGVVQVTGQSPVNFSQLTLNEWATLTTGQVFSPERISESGLNLSDKASLNHAWDIHAERVLACTDCHYALNNPVYYREADAEQPDHLLFDPRRLDFGEYLYRPLHQFAKGESVQSALAPEFDNTLRGCDSCHSISATHEWLPYKERHTDALACESCHVPQVHAPALASIDWTVLTSDGQPLTSYRGTEGGLAPQDGALISGFEPVLLPRQNADGTTSLAPFNLVTAYFWVYGEPARPVPLANLQAAYLVADGYQADVLVAFDANQDQVLDTNELKLDNNVKVTLIAQRLSDGGLSNPRVVGEVQPYNINHGVVTNEWATKDCQTCHSSDSRLKQPLLISNAAPTGVTPTWVNTPNLLTDGTISSDGNGAVYFTASLDAPSANYYIFGHDAVWWVDMLGALMMLGVFAVIAIHGGLRYRAAQRYAAQHAHDAALKKVYMYSVYERFWHWLQTIVILGLVFTGLVIHKPDTFSLFYFGFIVTVHNIFAVILVVNAALSLFYHLASGEIQQFIPRPYGFFDQMIVQAKYYVWGIFHNAPHPFEKVPERKLNPLQQMTYFGILNVLLPLQMITGVLMWGKQEFPTLTAQLGGLPFLAPFHTLIAWTFASFIVAHVYLTTTGHTPLENIKAMMLGWEDVEGAEPVKPAHSAGD